MPFVTYLSVKRGRHRASFYIGFKLILARAGLDERITPHDLRRTAAVKMLNATGDIRDVQSLLGHKRLANTVWYLDHGTQKLSHQLLEQVKQGRVN